MAPLLSLPSPSKLIVTNVTIHFLLGAALAASQGFLCVSFWLFIFTFCYHFKFFFTLRMLYLECVDGHFCSHFSFLNLPFYWGITYFQQNTLILRSNNFHLCVHLSNHHQDQKPWKALYVPSQPVSPLFSKGTPILDFNTISIALPVIRLHIKRITQVCSTFCLLRFIHIITDNRFLFSSCCYVVNFIICYDSFFVLWMAFKKSFY